MSTITQTQTTSELKKSLTSDYFNFSDLKKNIVCNFSKIKNPETENATFPCVFKLNKNFSVPIAYLRNCKTKKLSAKNFSALIKYVDLLPATKKYFVQMIVNNFNIENVATKKMIYKFAYQIKLQLKKHLHDLKNDAAANDKKTAAANDKK